MNDDNLYPKVYDGIRGATPEELLEAVVWFYMRGDNPAYTCERMLRIGFAVAQPGGWEQVAPDWLGQAYSGVQGYCAAPGGRED